MPEQNQNLIMQFLSWSWIVLLEVIRRGFNRIEKIEKKVEKNKDNLHEQEIKHLEDKEDMVTHTYIETEIKPMFESLNKKLETLLNQTADIIKRKEYQAGINKIEDKVSELHKRVDNLK